MKFIEQLNLLGSSREPFFFLISFDKKESHIQSLKNLDNDIHYEIEKTSKKVYQKKLTKDPVEYKVYKEKFDKVQNEIREGNTYLLNLTTPTTIKIDQTLWDIYNKVNARYKLYFKDQFISFSPEKFIEIENNKIYTYPMKGTIDANIPGAKDLILNDSKELAEHTMIVDLLRNDLGIVASKIRVEDFRYVEKIQAGEKELLQVSSKISGELDTNWHDTIGSILDQLLPAGSISGTPKKKTVEIIQNIEQYDRKFFTGVFGVYDGKSLKSGVLIRFIEKQKDGTLLYKSGGGITCDSDCQKEYQEMIDKVYLP